MTNGPDTSLEIQNDSFLKILLHSSTVAHAKWQLSTIKKKEKS